MKSIFIFLGVCGHISGELGMCYIETDEQILNELCEAQIAAKHRDIKPSDVLEDRPGFPREVALVCWPKDRC